MNGPLCSHLAFGDARYSLSWSVLLILPSTRCMSPTRVATNVGGVAPKSKRRLWLALAKSAKMHPLQRRMISWPGLGLGLGLGFGFGFATQDDLLLISVVAPRPRGDN